jgi:hypothetical protein
MQAAAKGLISLDEKWAPYRFGLGLEPDSKPTNMAESRYNPADEITVIVTLKSPVPGETSFLNYAFEDRESYVGLNAHYLFACAGVRTANGQIHAVTARMGQGKDNKVSAIGRWPSCSVLVSNHIDAHSFSERSGRTEAD